MNAALQDHPQGQILLNVPAEEYQRRELGTATSGVLHRLRTQTPAHHKAWAASADEGDTPAKVFGKAYHCRVLEPARFAELYCQVPEDAPRDLRHLRSAAKPSESTLEAIQWWDAWAAENEGKVQLSRDDLERIEEMHAALMSNPVIATLMTEGESEVTLRWVDEETGVPCKARFDRWIEGRRIAVDLKSTDDANPVTFAKSIDRYGYHIQHAHYCEGARVCGMPLKNFLIIAQEKEPPYVAAVYQLDEAAEARGFELRARGMKTLQQCRETNTWPGYTGITELSLPAYALKD